jgi:hypothetical protein
MTDSQIAAAFNLSFEKVAGNPDQTEHNASVAITNFIQGGCK